jgi:hypothetical protein
MGMSMNKVDVTVMNGFYEREKDEQYPAIDFIAAD